MVAMIIGQLLQHKNLYMYVHCILTVVYMYNEFLVKMISN